MATDWTARVLDHLEADRDAMVRAAADLVRTPSVSGSDAEHEVQADLARLLGEDGLEVDHWRLPLEALQDHPDFPGAEVDRDEAWGVVGRRAGRGGGRTLLLQGHVDVVPAGDPATWTDGDPFSGRLTGTTLHGRGACDMKAGVIAARWAARALQRAEVPLRGDLLLATVAGEEDGGTGSFGLLERGWRADACVIPEPTGLDIVPACAGALTFRLRLRGRAAHASRRTEGVSAIEKLGPVMARLRRLEADRNQVVDDLFARWDVAYPIEVGTVRAGDWPSSVPDALVAEGRLGVALDETVEEARAALEGALADLSRDDPWLRANPIEVEWWGGQFASGRLPAASDLADRVAVVHEHCAGAAPERWGAPYGSDLRLLSGLGGIPTVHHGPGRPEVAHAADEVVSLAEIHTSAQVLARLALDVCGVG